MKATDIVGWLALLLGFQLMGEAVRAAFALALPGPVIGMAALFVMLLIRGETPEGLEKTADGLLANLALFFVPAGVGVMLHLDLLADEWPALLGALILSTAIAVATTGLVAGRLLRGAREETR